MSVQSEINRINGEVSDQTDIIEEIREVLAQKVAGGGVEFTWVGEGTVSYTAIKVDIKHYPKWQEISVNDVYVVPRNFIVFSTEGAASGTITCGTYAFNKSYSNGVLSLSRASVSGKVGINFDCDIYVLK